MRYADARGQIRHGDVLLFRGRGLFSCIIKRRTRSTYSHAALAFWIGSRLMLAESREGQGVRLLPLSAAVRDVAVHVYRPRQPLLAREADVVFDRALSLLGQAYGWHEIGRIALSLIPGWPAPTWSPRDDRPSSSPICSQYVSICYRAAGRDLVPNLDDGSTTPGDLSRSAALDRVLVIGR